jgi:WD40 repeat protein
MAGWEQRVLAATVEILDDRGKRIGSGVLIDEARVLTAGHVVSDNSGTLPKVFVRFTTGIVHECIRVIPDEADVAVVALPEGSADSLPAPVAVAAPERRLPEHVRVMGFPSADRTTKGVWRSFRVGGPVGARGEYRQLDWEDPTGSFKGHSGGPVVDASTGELVGILTEGSEAGAFDRFLGMRVISAIVTGLPARWVFAGEEARAHVTRRAHGHLSNDVRGGDFFTGREAALAKVRDWLKTGHEVGRPLVLTGQPGAGKSAVLGRAALAGEALGFQAGLVFHAHSATYAQFLDGVRQVVDIDLDEDVLVGLRLRVPVRGLAVMVDALDEAATRRDAEQIAGTLAGMAGVPGVAVVVATRPGTATRSYARGTLLALLNVQGPQASSFVDLDSDAYFDPTALVAFAAGLLTQVGAECPYPADGAWPHYREDRRLADRLANAIADRARKNYLVAALTAVSLSENMPVVDPDAPGFDPKQLPAKIGEALDKVIDRQAEPMARLTRGLLTALAHAEGSGISDDLWIAFSKALHYEAGPASLRDFKASSVADFLLQASTDDAVKVTRLFHQALTDELLGPNPDPSDAAAIYQTVLDDVRERGGWTQAGDYALAQAPTHALKAGRLVELLTDSDALARCDPALLSSAILEDQDARKSLLGRVVIRAAGLVSRLPPGQERTALLTLTGAHMGLVLPLGTKTSPGWTVSWAHSLGKPHQELTGHEGGVNAVAVGRLGGLDVVVSAGLDGSVRLWDEHGAAIGNPWDAHEDRTSAVEVGRLGGRDVVVSAGGGTMRLWDEHGAAIGNPWDAHEGGVFSMAVGRLGGRDVVVSGGGDGTVRLWDEHGAAIGNAWDAHEGGVNAVAVGRLGGRDVVVSAGGDGTVRLWDEHGAVGNPWEGHEDRVNAVAVGRLGGRDVVVSAGEDRTVRLWDEHGAAIGNLWERQMGRVFSVEVGRLGGRDVVVSADAGGTLSVWDAQGAAIGNLLAGDLGYGWAVAMGRLGDRDVVVSAGLDGSVRLWDEHGAAIGNAVEGHEGLVEAVAMGRLGGRDVVVSAGDRTVRVWDENGAPIGNPWDAHEGGVFSMAVGRLGGRDVVVSAGGDGTVRVWDEHGAAIGSPWVGHKHGVEAVAVGRLGGRDVVVSAGWDGTVRLWDEHGTAIGNPWKGDKRGVDAVAVGRLGGRDVVVSAGGDGTVRLWDEHGAAIGNPSEGHEDRVNAVAVGRLGGRDVVVSGGSDGTVRLWDEHGAAIGNPWEGHEDRVNAVAVGRLGCRDVVVSGGSDGTVRVWDEHGAAIGNPLKLLTEVPALAMDGSVLAVATGRAIARFKWT